MTTYGEVKAWVQATVGDADQTLFLAADLMRYANAAQREICRRARLLTKIVTGSVTLSNFDIYGGLLLPTDFVVELEVYFGSPLVRLDRIPLDVFWQDSLPAVGTTEQPTSYAISDYLTGAQNNQRHLLLYPYMQPGLTNKPVRVSYNAMPATITADADILQLPDQFIEVMVWLVTRSCRIQLDDYQGARALKQLADERIIELTSEFRETSAFMNRTIRSEVDVMSYQD